MNLSRITTDDLINKVSEKKKTKYIYMHVKSLDGVVKVRVPKYNLMMESIDISNKEGEYEGNLHLLYESIVEPNLKDTRLHEAYNVDRPYDVISEIFSFGEILSMVKNISQSADFNTERVVTLVDDIKN